MSLPWELLVPASIGVVSIARIFTELIHAKMVRATLQEALKGSRPDERPPIVTSMAELLRDAQVSRQGRAAGSSTHLAGVPGNHGQADLYGFFIPGKVASIGHGDLGQATSTSRVPYRRGTDHENQSHDSPVINLGRPLQVSRETGPRTPNLMLSGQNCSIFLVDIAGFGGKFRSGEDREAIRHIMYTRLQEVFDRSGVPWRDCYRRDCGDGVLIIVPPGIPTSAVADPLLGRLAQTLRLHNSIATEATRIQLRVALHVGPVISDPHGMTGEAILHAARMVESPVLKKQLAGTGADLGVISSTFVYEVIIRSMPACIGTSGYRQVKFRVKESAMTAWMLLFGEKESSREKQRWGSQYIDAGHMAHPSAPARISA